MADNTWRDGSAELNNTEASFVADGGISIDQRKMNAVRAYFEWMPIRQVEMDDNLRIWRSFSIGSLFDLVMLDTRQYDRSITDLYWNTDYIHNISNDVGRSMMGSRQENWSVLPITSDLKTHPDRAQVFQPTDLVELSWCEMEGHWITDGVLASERVRDVWQRESSRL